MERPSREWVVKDLSMRTGDVVVQVVHPLTGALVAFRMSPSMIAHAATNIIDGVHHMPEYVEEHIVGIHGRDNHGTDAEAGDHPFS
jgi:hypothetical protein